MKTAEKEAKRESLKQRKDSDILNDIFSNQDQELGQDLADMLDEKEIPVFDEEAGEEIVDFEDDISKQREHWEAECPGREELDAEEVKEIQNESNKSNEAQDESNEANEANESRESSKEDREREQAKGQKADWEKVKEQEAEWEQTKDTQIDWGQSNGQDSVWEQPGENQRSEDQPDENQPNAENPGYKPWPVSEEMREKERTTEDSLREKIIVQIPDAVMQEQPQDEREIQPEKAIFNPSEDDNAPVVYIDFSQEVEEHEKKRSKDLLNTQEQGEGKNGAEWNLEEDVKIEQDDEEQKKRPWWHYLLIALGVAAMILLLLLFL